MKNFISFISLILALVLTLSLSTASALTLEINAEEETTNVENYTEAEFILSQNGRVVGLKAKDEKQDNVGINTNVVQDLCYQGNGRIYREKAVATANVDSNDCTLDGTSLVRCKFVPAEGQEAMDVAKVVEKTVYVINKDGNQVVFCHRFTGSNAGKLVGTIHFADGGEVKVFKFDWNKDGVEGEYEYVLRAGNNAYQAKMKAAEAAETADNNDTPADTDTAGDTPAGNDPGRDGVAHSPNTGSDAPQSTGSGRSGVLHSKNSGL